MKPISTITPLRLSVAACLIFASNVENPALWAQGTATATASSGLSYADIADLATAAPLVAKAQIVDVISLSKEQSAGAPAGYRRVYVEARVTGLIRGDNGISPVVSYLYDAPLDARGKMPKLKKKPVLLFARPGGQPGQIQLVARDAQIDLTPANDATTKAIVSQLLGSDAPPRIADVGDAFHVAGTVVGEGETQIFLKTDSGQPVSLSIIRRPGEQPQWAVALGEVVDEAAAAPQRDTLLWYRLACGLPSQLPPKSVRTLSVQDAEAARADYALVLSGLGSCGRTRQPG